MMSYLAILDEAPAGEVGPIVEASDTLAARPLRVMFVQTSMPVGGAETLLVNLIRRLDRERIEPELVCLKQRGPLGELLADEIPVHHSLLRNKYDLRVLPRLVRLLRRRAVDAVVTVGAGDKMFWGRLAAKWAGVPVVLSALHSTGWPDGIGWLNRLLTPLTDAFIAVAPAHGRFLVEVERFPSGKVVVVPNGVDTERFGPGGNRGQIHFSAARNVEEDLASKNGPATYVGGPVVSIVAALRPEKNHELFLRVARRVIDELPEAQFAIVGEGPRLAELERLAAEIGITSHVHFLGSRDDVPELLAATDVFALTSHNEANPVSVLEAMSVGCPVVATDVGSVGETLGDTGLLVPPGDVERFSAAVIELLRDPLRRQTLGEAARERVVGRWSIDVMVCGYERLIESIYAQKRQAPLVRRVSCN